MNAPSPATRPTRSEAEILDLVRAPVRRFLGRTLRDDHAADDATSETLLIVLRELRDGTDLRDPASFALGVAWRKSREALRARRRTVPADDAAPPAAAGFDPRRAAEIREWLDAAFARLTEGDRALLALRYEQDLDYRTIAGITGLSTGAIGWRLFRARAALKRELGRTGDAGRVGLALALLPGLGESTTGLGKTVATLSAICAAFLATGVGAWVLLADPRPPEPAIEPPGPPRTVAREDAPRPPTPTVARTTPFAESREAPPEIPDEPAPPTFVLHGAVLAEDGAALRGATVTFERRRATPTRRRHGVAPLSATTDARGTFRLEILDDPSRVDLYEYDVAAVAPGYRETTFPAYSAHEDGLEDGRRRLRKDFKLPAYPSFSGVVRDAQTGAPIADAVARLAPSARRPHELLGEFGVEDLLDGPQVVFDARCDAEGRFAIGGLRHVPWEFAFGPPTSHPAFAIAAARGYATALWVGPEGGGSPEAETAEARLRPGGDLLGRVVDADGEGVPDRPVLACADEAALRAYRAFQPATEAYPLRRTFHDVFVRRALTDEDGYYRVERLPLAAADVARWYVRVGDATATEPRLVSVAAPKPGSPSARETMAAEIRLGDVRLGDARERRRARVRVVDGEGRPIRGAAASLSAGTADGRTSAAAEATTDREGRATLVARVAPVRTAETPSGAAAASFAAAVLSAPPFLDVRSPGFRRFREPLRAAAQGRDAEPIVVRLAPARRIAGRVIDAEGRPVAGARVKLRLASEPPSTAPPQDRREAAAALLSKLQEKGLGEVARTDREGRFAFVDPTTSPVFVVAEARSYRGPDPSTAGATWARAFPQFDTAEAGPLDGDAPAVELALSGPCGAPTGTLIVRARDAATEEPLRYGLRMELARGDRVVAVAEHRGPDDEYALYGVPAGAYRLRVGESTTRRGYADVEVPPHATATVVVDLHRGRRVEGEVAGPDGPIANAAVFVVDDRRKTALGPKATTDASGRFVLDGVGLERGTRNVARCAATTDARGRTWIAAEVEIVPPPRGAGLAPSTARFAAEEAVVRPFRLRGFAQDDDLRVAFASPETGVVWGVPVPLAAVEGSDGELRAEIACPRRPGVLLAFTGAGFPIRLPFEAPPEGAAEIVLERP
jgi:RNA polymerase sigma factor (sigma-70 family)